MWPGGAQNPSHGYDGWIECYANLRALTLRHELMNARTEHSQGQLETVVRAAAARQPISVGLSIGPRKVYPKSAWALSWLDSLDDVIAPLVALQVVIAEGDASPDLRAYPALAKGLAWQTWAWILLTEQVGLPFPSEGEITVPEEYESLLFQDFLLIYQAHRKLHHDDITLMALAMPRETGEASRLSLGGFLAGYASEHGVPPSELMHRWSFPEAMAAAVSTFEAHRVAEANAKRKQAAAG